MKSNRGESAYFPNELDPEVRTALEYMLSQTPDERQLEVALKRLRRPAAPTEAARSTKAERRGWRLGVAVAASFLLCLLWLGAQTETWGRVAQEFQHPSAGELAGPAPETPITRTLDGDEPVGSWRRFVLIIHVFGMSIGLLGLFTTWCCSLGHWLIATCRRSPDRCRKASWVRRILLWALTTYGGGITFGCVWSQASWGVFWQWDPRESLPLVTLGIGMMWYTTSMLNDAGDPRGRAIRAAFIAALAWWMIVLLYVLAYISAARLHSYGFPSRLPTAVACLWGLNMLPLCAAYVWRRWRGSVPVPETN